MLKIIKRNNAKLVVLHCLIPLLSGGFFYILFRTTELRMFKWFAFWGLDSMIFSARANLTEFKNYLPSWTYYSLPDGLWVYSFTSALIIYWNNNNKKLIFWLLIPFITGILVEILQGFRLFPGTFDFLDLFFSTLGLCLSKIIISHKLNQNEKTAY